MSTALAPETVATETEPVNELVLVVDIVLTEFTRRNAVPADDIIEAIEPISPETALTLKQVTSRFENEPGILHYRDAINPLLDLRQHLATTT